MSFNLFAYHRVGKFKVSFRHFGLCTWKTELCGVCQVLTSTKEKWAWQASALVQTAGACNEPVRSDFQRHSTKSLQSSLWGGYPMVGVIVFTTNFQNLSKSWLGAFAIQPSWNNMSFYRFLIMWSFSPLQFIADRLSCA